MEIIVKGLNDKEILLRLGLSKDLQGILAGLLDRGGVFAKDGNCGNCADCSKCSDCGKCTDCKLCGCYANPGTFNDRPPTTTRRAAKR